MAAKPVEAASRAALQIGFSNYAPFISEAPSTKFEAYKKVSAGSAASGGRDIFGRGD
jgi:hypothetical protein